MEDLFRTLINIAFYIFIFRLLFGGSKRNKPRGKTTNREPQQQTESPNPYHAPEEKKKKESFFAEALRELKKLEEQARKQQEPVKKRIPKPAQQKPVPVAAASRAAINIDTEFQEPGRRKEKDEKNKKMYYNEVAVETSTEIDEEQDYLPRTRQDLKKAIVYSEIIGKPVSARRRIPVRR